MKTKTVMVFALVLVAGVLTLKWFVGKPETNADASESAAGGALVDDAAAPTPAAGKGRSGNTADSAAGVAGADAGAQELAGAAPQVGAVDVGTTAGNVAVADEEMPEQAVADCDTGRAHDRGLAANQAGDFPRVLIETNQVVPVSLMFPGGAGAGAVTVRVLDGGSLDGRDVTRVLPVDGNGRVNFSFHAGEGRGSYRVTVRRGDWRQQLQFWAGPPHEIARTPLPEGAHLADKL